MNTTQTQFDMPARPHPGRPPRQPSGRNLEIYHELVYERRRQRDVAARFHVSRPRIAQLRRQIAAWVDALLPADVVSQFNSTDPGSRFHLAIACLRVQLAQAYQAHLAEFRGPIGATTIGHLQAAKDAGILPPAIASRLPNRAQINNVLRMVRELDDLARVARRGPFAYLPDELRQPPQQAHNCRLPTDYYEGKDNLPLPLQVILNAPQPRAPLRDATTIPGST